MIASVHNIFNRNLFQFYLKWILIILFIGVCVGSASAIFLITLSAVTDFREANIYIIWGLPFIGLLIGYIYMKYGRESEAGNKVLVTEINQPKSIISWRMAPLVYFGTILTHLFGGSAGREGTALQMACSISDQISTKFKLTTNERRALLLSAVAAGFGSVFGTPLAGIVFSFEFAKKSLNNYWVLIPVTISSFLANTITHLWNVEHTVYTIFEVPTLGYKSISLAILSGVLFGLTGRLFKHSLTFSSFWFNKLIPSPPIRPLVGGFLIVASYYLLGTHKFLGLGVPIIVQSFMEQMIWSVFIIKLILTVLTISSGFKGGEVTPLFFIGATLGSTISLWFPLPTSLLAGMGFVGVFSGATLTPIACSLMGMELFGLESGFYIAIACIVAYLVAGKKSIYD